MTSEHAVDSYFISVCCAQFREQFKLVYGLSLRQKRFELLDQWIFVPWEGGTPLYGLYRYVRPQKVWFFSRFGHK